MPVSAHPAFRFKFEHCELDSDEVYQMDLFNSDPISLWEEQERARRRMVTYTSSNQTGYITMLGNGNYYVRWGY